MYKVRKDVKLLSRSPSRDPPYSDFFSSSSPHLNLPFDKSSPIMRFFVSSDETGNIKEVICASGVDTSKKDSTQPELVNNILQTSDLTNVKNRIVHMATFEEKWIVTTRLGGFVTVYDMYNSSENSEENYSMSHKYKLPVDNGDKPVALIKFEKHDYVMVAFESSVVFVIYFNGGKFDVEPISFSIPVRQEKETEETTTLTAFVQHPYIPDIFASGGKNNDLQVLKIFNTNKKRTAKAFNSSNEWKVEVVFLADNVEPDHLGIEAPIWISNILFCKDTPRKGYKLITSTRYGNVRKYDTLEDTEPTGSYKVCDKPIVTLNFATENQDEIIISDTHTFVARLSLTKIDAKAQRIVSASAGTFYKPGLKLLGKYSEGGNTGAIHGVDVDLSTGIVVFGGLDRYLRVFNITTRALIMKVYLGTQISSLIILDSSNANELNEKKRDLEADDDDEKFWNDLDHESKPAPIIKKKRRI